MGDGGQENVPAAEADPAIRGHVEGWGKHGDLGVIALDSNGEKIGAAWVRLGAAEVSEYKLGDEQIPELAMAVLPSARHEGAGFVLLRALLARCRERFPAVVLSVREANPAVRLYEKVGFRVVREHTNRIGGKSLIMQIELKE